MRAPALNHPLAVIAVISILTLTALFFIPRIKFDDSVEAFFDKDSESYVRFQEWKDEFGDDQVIIVSFSASDIFTENNLRLISALTEEFEALEYAHEVESITTVNDIVGRENDFIVRPLIEEIPSRKAALKKLREGALKNPLYVKNVISEDGKTASIMIELERRPEGDDSYKRETMESVLKILKQEFPKDKKYYVSGPTAMEFFYTSFMRKDLKTFLPITFLIIAGILIFSFRSVAGFLLPMFAISIALILTMFFFYLSGFSLNNITTAIPPIILAVAVANSIHFVGRAARNTSPEEAVRKLLLPCFLTSLTTAIGFLSLTASRLPPIREMGMVVAVGVILAFLVTFTFTPAVIKKFRPFRPFKKPEEAYFLSSRFDSFMIRLGVFNRRFTNVILIGALGAAFISLWGITRIEADTNVLDYFKKDSFIHKSTKYIDKHLSGTNFLEISLRSGERDFFKEPVSLGQIERLQGFLKELPEVDKATSVTEYIKEINKSFHNEDPAFYAIPASRKLVSQYLLLYGATDLKDYIDSEWKWATVRVRLNEYSGAGIKKVIGRIEDYLDKSFSLPVEKELLGWPVLDIETNAAITEGQIRSLSLAMLIIFAMMFVVFKSVPLGLISIVPNALPIALNLGIMGILGIRMDAATSIISAVGIGIIVDDTIHFMHNFKEEVKRSRDYPLAVERALVNKGRPIILTSVILFFGFGVFVFSGFNPMLYFGALSASMMLTALLGDLIVLPALLLYFKPEVK